MIHVHIEGLKEVENMLQQLKVDKIPTATRNAINDTAYGLKSHLQKLISTTFPTANPKTAKNIFVMKASKEYLYARVHFDQLYKSGLNEYMMPLIEGGGRAQKPAEKRLGNFYVPGKGAKLNRYGNMSGGQVTQILSRLGLFGDVAGYDMNQTAASRRRLSAMQKRTGKKSTEYFLIKNKTGGLAPGIYRRVGKGGSVGSHVAKKLGAGNFQRGQQRGDFWSIIRGRGAQAVMLFVKQPTYRPMLPFFTSGTEYANKALVENFTKEIRYHLQHGGGR